MWSLNVCTYNVMTPVLEPLRFNGQWDRLRRIPPALLKLHQQTPGGLDVLVLQELIPGQYRRFLLAKLAELGWNYSTQPLQAGLWSSKLVSGGVLICSRHPLLAQKQRVFTSNCASTDCLASKGVVYAQILSPTNNIVNVFATHFQAWASPEGVFIRQAQAEECRSFIHSLNLHPEEAVLFAGDLNLDYYTKRSELSDLERRLRVEFVPLHTDSYPFSSDPNTNAMMGNDDASMYSTRLYPNGCYDAYIATQKCPCCPQELLDYVGYSTQHLLPVHCSASVVLLKTAEFNMKLNLTTERQLSDLSDHYPVVGTFHWNSPSEYHLNTGLSHSYQNQPLTAFILFAFVVVLVVLMAWCGVFALRKKKPV